MTITRIHLTDTCHPMVAHESSAGTAVLNSSSAQPTTRGSIGLKKASPIPSSWLACMGMMGAAKAIRPLRSSMRSSLGATA